MTTFCLYTMQTIVVIPGFGSLTVLAEENEDVGLPSISSNPDGRSDGGEIRNHKSSGGFFSGGAGANVGLDGKEKTGNDEAGLNMNMIILLAAVMAAPLYVMYCFDKVDTWIFTATAVIYVASEIANWKTYKAQSDREMKAFNSQSVEGNQAQQASLYEAAGQTEAAADAADRRSMAAQIASAGFFAAGALALIMTALSYWTPNPIVTPKGYACSGGLVGYSIEQDYLYGVDSSEMIADTNYSGLENYLQASETNLDFLVRNVELKRYVKGATHSMNKDTFEEIEFMYPDARTETGWANAFKTVGYNIADLIFPAAHADMKKVAALGLGAAAATALAMSSGLMNAQFKAFMRNGFVRAAGHLAFGTIAQIVAGNAKKAAQALRGRAAQYKELAAKLGIVTLATANHSATDNTYEVGKLDQMKIDGGGPTVGTCFTGSRGQLNEDSKCACKEAKNCKRSEVPKIASMATVSIPSAITSSTGLTGDAGNAIFSGDLEGGLANSNAAGQNAARLKKLMVGLKKKTNDTLNKFGGKPVDFDKLEASTRSRLIKAAVADIGNLNDASKAALSDRFPGVFGEGEKVEDPNKDIKLGNTKVKTGGGIATSKGGKGSSKKKDPMAGFSFDLEDDAAEIKNPEDGELAKLASDTSDQVEMNADDIDSDRNKNIFSLITKRYFKTAYPTFFDKVDDN